MQPTGNTILITGGGSGIGRALAEAFHKLGNHVIIAGRRKDALDQVTSGNPGMISVQFDTDDASTVPAFIQKLITAHPSLNAVILNAGIMRPEDLLHHPEDLSTAEATINTNLLGPIRLTAALLPHLLQQPRATIMTVTSGLAFTPMAVAASYCATKAAIHSWSQSLRYQLRDTKVQVQELIPPYVQTELMGAQQTTDPRAMPLKEFIEEVMQIITTQPQATEICVQRVLPLRYAAEGGQAKYDAFHKQFNDAMASH